MATKPKRKTAQPSRRYSVEKIGPRAGTAIIWPSAIEDRYDISALTRLRWEKDGRLPRRDVFIGGKPSGWKPETLAAADRGDATTRS